MHLHMHLFMLRAFLKLDSEVSPGITELSKTHSTVSSLPRHNLKPLTKLLHNAGNNIMQPLKTNSQLQKLNNAPV